MGKVKYIQKRLVQVGFINLTKSFYYSRIVKPFYKKYNRHKFSKAEKYLSDKIFFDLINFNSAKISSGKNNYSKSKIELINYIDDRGKPNFFISKGKMEELKDIYLLNFQSEVFETSKKAELILKNDLSWVTPNCPHFDQKINWRRDFFTNKEWSLDFFMDLDIFSENSLGDSRQLWELNRLQFLTTLGKAYLITEDEKYTKKFITLINDWIEENPCGYGINWHNSQESALRMTALIWSYFFFNSSKHFTTDSKINLIKVLYQHAEYTFYKLSRSAVTHNHLVSEICGLAVFCIVFPFFKKSKSWLRQSIKIFEREVIKQIWEDGPSGELSTSYHLFVLDSFLQLMALLDLNNIKVKALVRERIASMIEYAMYFIKPDGSIPKLGDNDSGRAFKLTEYNPDDRRSYLAIGAVLFNRKDFKKIAGKFYEEAFWLLGDKGKNRFDNIKPEFPNCGSRLFENAGIAIMRSGWQKSNDYLIFRGGPTKLRTGVSASHNHADYLSFEFYSNGVTFFIDPGTYLYNLNDEMRFYFRKSISHNTISIDDLDHMNVTNKRFGIPVLPLAKLINYKFEDSFDFIEMSHAGYENLGVTHTRKVVFVKLGYIILIDLLYGNGDHKVDQVFNLDTADIKFNDQKDQLYVHQGNQKFNLLFLNNFASRIKLSYGENNPMDGWASYRYGEIHPANVIHNYGHFNLPIVLCTVIIKDSIYDLVIENYKLEFGFQNFVFKNNNFVDSINIDNSSGLTLKRKLNN